MAQAKLYSGEGVYSAISINTSQIMMRGPSGAD
jgi:hypothetical protein